MSGSRAPTPGQTIGPFFGYSLPYAGGPDLVPPAYPGAVRLHGLVLDGAGGPVPDALVEIWQCAPDGSVVQQPGSLRRDGWTFTGWGRSATDAAGHYSFCTLRPGVGDGAGGGYAPFFAVTVFARGLLNRLFTRAYVPGDDRLATDRLLSRVPAERRSTLIAEPDGDGYHFDVVLQGPDETVFLSYRQHAR